MKAATQDRLPPDATDVESVPYPRPGYQWQSKLESIGGIWKKQNQNGGDYFTLSVNTGYGRLNANLGRYPGQDDDALMAVIPWD